MGNYKELKIWNRAKELSVKIYKTTAEGKFSRDYGLRDQVRRASVSVASNIAEGDEMGTNKHSIRFFNYAKGSLAEVRTQLAIAFEIGYLTEQSYTKLDQECDDISKMISSLIKHRTT